MGKVKSYFTDQEMYREAYASDLDFDDYCGCPECSSQDAEDTVPAEEAKYNALRGSNE